MRNYFLYYHTTMTDLFISYASEDLERVRPLVAALKDQGWSVWWDRALVAGPSYEDKIEKALEAARCVVIVWSRHSIKSQWVRTEAHEGLEREILVPLLIDDVKPPLAYRIAQTAKLLDWPDQAGQLESVMDGITELLGKPTMSESGKIQRQRSSVEPALNPFTHSIAVLPFANMTTNEETGNFADGLSEDILDNLAQIKNIKVASHLASIQFTDRGQAPSVIGEKLKVAYLLAGSVRQRGDNLRIIVQLIRTGDGYQVWSKSYTRSLADGFEMQTAVAINIANIAQSKLNFDVLKNYGWKQQDRFKGINPVAVEHFISAIDEYNNIRLGEGGDFPTYLQFLKNAVEVDSNFYEAYSDLANAYFQWYISGRLLLPEARPAAHAAITSAIALAPDNAASQMQLAMFHSYLDLDFARAVIGFRKYLMKYPKHGWSNFHLASIALREGRTNEALRQMANASEFTVNEMPLFLARTAWIRIVSGDYEGALKASARGLRFAHTPLVLRMHATSLVMLGRTEEAKTHIEEGWQLDGSLLPESYVYLFAKLGEIEKSKRILSDSDFDLIDHYHLAMGHLTLGDIDNAFKSIQAGIENHNPLLIDCLIVSEWWNPIRADPRFKEMLELLDSKVTHTEQYLRDHNITED